MKTTYLFPNKFKIISGTAFIISFILLIGYITYSDETILQLHAKAFALINEEFMGDNNYFEWIDTVITDELLMILVICSGIVYAFSKEKQEDELVAAIRLNSLAWATIANYLILLFCYLFIFGLPFLTIMLGAVFSQLIIFIALFRIKIYKFSKSGTNEE